MASRSAVIGQGYCYHLTGATVARRVSGWQELPIHTLLLLCDIGRRYTGEVSVAGAGRLFELIVAAAARKLFRGPAARFGWPIEPGWPTAVEARVERLAEELGLETEALDGKLQPTSKDEGLDVAARLSLRDNEAGTLTFLIQCATGKNWKSKTGEPSIAVWAELLRWNSLLVRGLAVPWRLEPPDDYLRTFKRFDGAIVLDRPRLLAADAEELLPVPVRGEILEWCEDRLSRIPILDS